MKFIKANGLAVAAIAFGVIVLDKNMSAGGLPSSNDLVFMGA